VEGLESMYLSSPIPKLKGETKISHKCERLKKHVLLEDFGTQMSLTFCHDDIELESLLYIRQVAGYAKDT
jgi:hypothetical protein